MNEAQVRARVLPGLRRHMAVSRVENSAEPGTPDLAYSMRQCHGWVELKVRRGGKLHMQKHQLPWMKSRLRHCLRGLWFLAVDDDGDRLYLYTAAQVCSLPVKVETFFRKPWSTVDVSRTVPVYLGQRRSWDWSRVADLMLG